MKADRLVIAAGAGLFLLVLLGAIQAIAELRVVSPVFFPSPLRIAEALYRQVAAGSIWSPLAQTCARMLSGWLLAVALGILFGAVIGSSARATGYLDPTLEFLRTLPASAVMPIFILFMGLTPLMIVSVISFGALWPVLLGSLHGFRSVEPRLLEVADTLELGRFDRLIKIAIPNAVPDILSGMRVSLAFALILSVVAEMLSSAEGLGNNVLLASRSFRTSDLYAGIMVLGVVGALTTAALGVLERRLLRWRAEVSH
jgi:ABC-type nitrate/sulfonate/bicarbonate transport system permease component